MRLTLFELSSLKKGRYIYFKLSYLHLRMRRYDMRTMDISNLSLKIDQILCLHLKQIKNLFPHGKRTLKIKTSLAFEK